MSSAIIELNKITKAYGDKVILSQYDLSVDEGQFVMLYGKSGIGKSTLLNIIGLIDCPDHGSYILDGEKVNFKNEKQLSLLRNTKIGIVFQMYYLIPKLTVLENVLTPLLYQKKSDIKGFKARAEELLEELSLKNKVNQIVDSLSGGEKQRVALARALITDPKIVVCDEPTGNLDAENTQIIMEILKRHSEKENKTIIMVSHNFSLNQYASVSYALKTTGLERI